MKTVKLYTKPTCPFCINALALFDALEVPYTNVDVNVDPEQREALRAEYDYHTVPMIFIGDEFIGGFSELNTLHQSGALKEKLAA